MVQGNYIGVDADGSHAVTNGWLTGTNDNGIMIQSGSHHNQIGGTEPGAGNVIAGHWEGGIVVDTGSSNNIIEGNRIGTNAAGTAGIGNGGGASFGDGEHNQVIGNLVSGNGTGIGIYGTNVLNQVTVVGNLIGTDITGTLPIPNTYHGIRIDNAPRARIGGANETDRNIISGGSSYGIVVSGANTRETQIQGNFIGTDITGTRALGNGTGIWIVDDSDGNLVGGVAPGTRNLISGNVYGVVIDYRSKNNRVQGNYIGTDVTGTLAITDGSGVVVGHSAAENYVGTDGDGVNDAQEGNLISGHRYDGVFLWAGAEDNVVAGNLIGTDPTGQSSVPNGSGVAILGSRLNHVGTNADGLSDELERNIISGNSGTGVSIYAWPDRIDGGANENVIAGNYIGTDISGQQALGNGSYGITLSFLYVGEFLAPPTGNIIGGRNPIERNIIAGNQGSGIFAARAEETIVLGNYIGVGADGSAALGNAVGVHLYESPNNLIGGSEPGARNVISANRTNIAISYEPSTGNRVQGNYIGLDSTGTQIVGAAAVGIDINAPANIIGTDGDGVGDENEGNVIAGVTGVHYAKAIAIGGEYNVVAGNRIGTDFTGTMALRNTVGIWVAAGNNRIGTNGDGISDALERNIVDIIEIHGLSDSGEARNVVAGNYIGTDITGGKRLGFGAYLAINGSSYNQIGTNADGVSDDLERNIIAGSDWNHAILIENATGNRVAGNYLGVGADGFTSLDNPYSGLVLLVGASGNKIGGLTQTERNIIAGNHRSGVHIDGSDNIVLGNYIGLDAFGSAMGNCAIWDLHEFRFPQHPWG